MTEREPRALRHDVTDERRAHAGATYLQQLTAALSGTVEKSKVVTTVVDAGCGALGAAAAFAWLLRDADTLDLVAARHDTHAHPVEGFETIAMSAPLPVCDVIRRAEPMMFESREAMEAGYPRAVLVGSPATAWAVLPLVLDGRAIGAASFSFDHARTFSAEDRELLTAMMSQAALALERCRLIDAERQARRDAESARLRERQLHVIAARLSSALTQQQIAMIACEETLATLGAFTCAATMRDGDEIVVLAATGRTDPGVLARLSRMPLDGPALNAEVVRTGQLVWCGSVAELERRYAALEHVWRPRGIRSWAAVPFAFEARATGSLSVSFSEERALVAEDRDFLFAVGQLTAQALERARLYEAHRASEDQLRLALDAGRAATWSMDLVTRSTQRDPSYRRLVGVEATEAGADFMSIHPDDRDIARDAFERTMRDGTPYEPEVRLRRDDGTYMWIRSHARLVNDADGKPRRLAGVIVDIDDAKQTSLRADAERRAHKDQLELAVERARSADRRKDEFLAMLGHELRNPLAPIATALELMDLKNGLDARRERDVIRRQVSHLSRLIDDLLDVSRITRGTIQLAREVLELDAVLAKAIEMASPLLEKRMQRLAVDVPRGELFVDADPMRLAQVFQNLLTNAAKYSDVQSTIELRARGDRDAVTIEVRDEGVGIAPELLPRLFDLFVQGERALDRAEGGLGIGLSVAKSLCELHGGTIEVASAGSGTGATFTVTLPRAERPQPVTSASDDRATVAMKPLGSPSRVLVVDDNVDAAAMLRDFLLAIGHEPAVAHDGPAALELASSFKPDIAVLDIGLPVMNGYELARLLREKLGNAKLRLIAITGYGQDTDRARSHEVGFEHHLTKPIELEALLALLRA